jgi:hypothetical protein
MKRSLCIGALALALAACGKAEEEDLQPAPVKELQGSWLMVNRATDCEHYFTVFSPGGMFRVFDTRAPRKQYAAITKFVLEPGKVTMGVSDLTMGTSPIATMVFSLNAGKLRLVDLLGPSGGSFKTPPDSVAPGDQAYLKNVYRLAEDRFAMDRCPAP